MYVDVASVNMRQFVKDVLYVASKGGVFTDECPAVKGLMLSVRLQLPDDVELESSPTIRVLAPPKPKGPSRQELERMSVEEIQEKFGVTGKTKPTAIRQAMGIE